MNEAAAGLADNRPDMNTDQALPLLGGLAPRQFMKRHWQKKPLLIRGAIPAIIPPISRAGLFALAARDDVQARLVVRDGADWRLEHGPFARRALPALKRPGWTLLVQGVDRLDDAAHRLLEQFRFVPDARLDDLMISYASDGGGVGPHFDRYDVFLLQARGKRRWRIGHQRDLTLEPGRPLKILANFAVEQEFVLDAGDMLYLPPNWAHAGDAIGECITCSIGFRAPDMLEISRELLMRLADSEDGRNSSVYRDPMQPATDRPAAIPAGLAAFASSALKSALDRPRQLDRARGEVLSEPQSTVWFDVPTDTSALCGPLQLDRRTRMLYDAHHVFINGESLSATGRDARLLRQLADVRGLSGAQVAGCSSVVRALLQNWRECGWIHARDTAAEATK